MADNDRYDLRVLVVDDNERWRQILKEALEQLGGAIKIDPAATYAEARQAIASHAYDLVTVDLALRGDVDDAKQADQQGMDLLRDLRGSRYNRDGCGLIMLTGYSTPARVREALKKYAVDDFLEKLDFDDLVFLTAARSAIRSARLRRAAARADRRHLLTISLSSGQLLGSEYVGPTQQGSHTAQTPVIYDHKDLVRRGNLLNLLILGDDPGVWRDEARSIGEQLHKLLERDAGIFSNLVVAGALPDRPKDMAIEFSGPAECLGVPFELIRNGDDYLGMKHSLTRRLIKLPGSLSRSTKPLYAFVSTLVEDGVPLRLLVVGANSDGNIPAAEAEAAALAAALRADLERLGIGHEVTELIGDAATVEEVRRALGSGHYHFFHYAGHGRHNDRLPEISGIVLHDGQLSAADLNMLVRDTDMHMVFLSCCLGARTAQQAGRGEFYGPLEALVRADVPVVLGYRWVVADEPAHELALRFYHNLWRSFAPGDALLQARKLATMGPRGRDDETWASPVLVVQNR